MIGLIRKLPTISIRWKLVSLCIVLVTLPTVILGALSYNTLKDQTYQNIENDLRIISSDWQKITRSYIEQVQRVLKREEVLVQKRLESVAGNVEKMLASFHELHGDNPATDQKKLLFDKIAQIKLGRSGYVSLLDTGGIYHLSKNRTQDGKNLYVMDKNKAAFMHKAANALKRLEGGDFYLMHYPWKETGRVETRMKMSVLSYCKPWELIISANIYYTDFKSYEIEKQLKYDLKHKMVNQRIGENGYIWVINSNGDYVVSKDLLRDGENIAQIRSKDGALFVREMISRAKRLRSEETAIYYYDWRNLGEIHQYQKVAAISYVPEWDWIISASAYHKDFLQGLKVIRTNLLVVCLSAIVIGAVIAYLAASFISNPIKQLQKVSIIASKGDLSAAIDPKIVARKDEVGSLARAFDNMMLNLKNMIHQQREIHSKMVAAKERAEAANAAKSDFLARMSHEIRTPLNAVTGLTQIVLKSDLGAEQRDNLNKVQIASRNLLEVINDILDFSKVEAGRLELVHAPFDLDEVLEQLADIFDSRVAQKDLELIFSVSSRVPRQLVGDTGRLTQVLTNLIENAVKFTEKGEIGVAVAPGEVHSEQQGKMALEFQVSDTGMGIAADVLPTLFDPFTQADRYLTRTHEGSGLGLAICKRLVELMGGYIEVESVPGRGSTFKFAALVAPQQQQLRRFSAPPDIRGLKALVVDDSQMSRQMLEDLLKSFTFDVSSVDTGPKALEALRKAADKAPYQLVLLDWKMPGMDGAETATAIRNDPAFKQPPVIVMVTGYHQAYVQAHIDSLAVDATLIKPIKPSRLFDALMALFVPEMAGLQRRVNQKSSYHSQLAGRRVLLVEDSDLNRDVAMAILGGAGLMVEVAENGKVAVDKVVQSPRGHYDAVLMDIQMPIMDGYEATRHIRQWEFKLYKTAAQHPRAGNPKPENQIAIIALTAHAMTGEKEKCLQNGMNDYLSKPIDEQELYRVLHRWIPPLNISTQAPSLSSSENAIQDQHLLDVDGALKRLGGRKPLYCKLMDRFIPECADAQNALSQHLSDGDWPAATRTVHTIKGVAATIGAPCLAKAAGALEVACKKEGVEIDGPLEAFTSELERTVKAVEGFLEKEKEA